jgi:NADH dehydrogenase/NADH:ubiquinone oxidoreductase subunit G
MNELHEIVANLEGKAQKLIHLHTKAQEENETLRRSNTEFQSKLQQKELEIKELEEKHQALKLANSLLENNETQKTTDIKLKINELVREIDKSIALLNR